MQTVEQNLARLYQLETGIINASASLLEKRAKLEAEIAGINAELLTLCPEERAESVTLTKAILDQVKARGETVKTSYYTVSYRSGYQKITYDYKKLDTYAEKNPEVLRYRKETWVNPTAKIKRV